MMNQEELPRFDDYYNVSTKHSSQVSLPDDQENTDISSCKSDSPSCEQQMFINRVLPEERSIQQNPKTGEYEEHIKRVEQNFFIQNTCQQWRSVSSKSWTFSHYHIREINDISKKPIKTCFKETIHI